MKKLVTLLISLLPIHVFACPNINASFSKCTSTSLSDMYQIDSFAIKTEDNLIYHFSLVANGRATERSLVADGIEKKVVNGNDDETVLVKTSCDGNTLSETVKAVSYPLSLVDSYSFRSDGTLEISNFMDGILINSTICREVVGQLR